MSASHPASSGGGFTTRFSISMNSSSSVASVVPIITTTAVTTTTANMTLARTRCETPIYNSLSNVFTSQVKRQTSLLHHPVRTFHHTPAVVMFTNASIGAAIHSASMNAGTVAATSGVTPEVGRVSTHASPVRSQSHFYHHPHPSHPLHHTHHRAAGVMPHFSVDSATYQQIIDRRKSFRTRGSLGPTIASAPSVEQEDYRTPKPTVNPIKNGKSFDFGGGLTASDSNGLVKVSADFLRLSGSRQQFRSLLGRRKLGQLPPAFTKIDYSHDSIESNNPSSRANHPLITVEDAATSTTGFGAASACGTPTIGTPIVGAGLRSSHNSGSGGVAGIVASSCQLYNQQHHRRPSISSTAATAATVAASLIDFQKHSFDSQSGKQPHYQALLPNNNQFLSPGPQLTVCSFKRANSRYGVPIDESAVKMVYKIRSQRLNTRVRITNYCVIMAMLGILLMVIDTEICGQALFGIAKNHPVSLILRSFVVISTVALLIEIIHYHINEILLELVDCGADDFRVVLTWSRIVNFMIEFFLCSICPLPFTGTVRWSFIEPVRYHIGGTVAGSGNGEIIPSSKDVPVDVLLSLMMLSRVYLIGRFMVLHSKQFQDASTRTLAALNRIQVNFAFVMKTVLDQRPVVFLSVFLLIFWITTAWTFAQCERMGRDEEPSILYTNALWFIAITFNGAVMSSILIAVISRKILLSQGQKNVNNFMNDSRLIQEHKNAAARVLQKTWHIYKCLQTTNTPDHVLRRHQRSFLDAIHKFRRIKNKIRVFNDDSSTSFQQMNRLMTEMHTSMQRLVNAQDEMREQIEVLQRAMRNHFINAHANNNNNGCYNNAQNNNNTHNQNDFEHSLMPITTISGAVPSNISNNVSNGYIIPMIPNVSNNSSNYNPIPTYLSSPRVAFDTNVQTHFIARASAEQSLESKQSVSVASISVDHN